ncbi:MAG: PilZ domain-containing protein [Candidatus Methylumidiphilus sp.]|nr:PilZ domain-containing protein [Pseudomonadota bacterium]
MNRNRQNYRKNLKVDGTMVVGSNEITFFTKDVSLDGFHACYTEAASLEKGDIVYVRLPMLKMEGVASTVWKDSGLNDVHHIGFKFLNMRGVGGSAYHYRESEQRISEI